MFVLFIRWEIYLWGYSVREKLIKIGCKVVWDEKREKILNLVLE